MTPMLRLKKFYQIHPYWSGVLFFLFCSLAGIFVEYLLNKDFIWTGIIPAVLLTGLYFLQKRREIKHQKS